MVPRESISNFAAAVVGEAKSPKRRWHRHRGERASPCSRVPRTRRRAPRWAAQPARSVATGGRRKAASYDEETGVCDHAVFGAHATALHVPEALKGLEALNRSEKGAFA